MKLAVDEGTVSTAFANLATIVEGHDAHRPAIISRNETTTYGELCALIAERRGRLAAAHVGPGDRVAIICSNGLPFVTAYFAILGVGAVAVPLNASSPAAELTHQLATVKADAIVLDRTAVAAFGHIDRRDIPTVRTVFVADAPVEDVDGALAWDAPATDGADADTPIAEATPDQLAVLVFTSGTAGAPRAAMLTHGCLRANLDQSRATTNAIRPDDVIYGVVPLSHIFGLSVVLGATVRAGATLVLVQRFDPVTALESFAARGVTIVPGVPTMWGAISLLDDAPADALASVRVAFSGAAKLPVATAQRILDRFGVAISEGYGLTEASPVVTTSAAAPSPRFGSVGMVLDGIELRIVDEAGDDALVGDAGEIWVRGANVFAGYLDDPEATARVLTADGWLRTGDVGYVDDEGWLYLVDRAKDLVIVSGFNVYPAEVEEVLAQAPGVADVGVIGVPHPHTGEAVKAFVVPAPGAHLDEESLIEFTHDHLARYKCPSKILIVDELPRNVSGKLLRKDLDQA